MTATERRGAIEDGFISIDPFSDGAFQSVSCELCVGDEAFVSGSDAKFNVAEKGSSQ